MIHNGHVKQRWLHYLELLKPELVAEVLTGQGTSPPINGSAHGAAALFHELLNLEWTREVLPYDD